jgi:hypothetical protein
LIGLFDGIIEIKEDMLGKMRRRLLDFLLSNACLNVVGNYC